MAFGYQLKSKSSIVSCPSAPRRRLVAALADRRNPGQSAGND